MANVGCRIRKEFERPDRKLIEALSKDIPVAIIDDCNEPDSSQIPS